MLYGRLMIIQFEAKSNFLDENKYICKQYRMETLLKQQEEIDSYLQSIELKQKKLKTLKKLSTITSHHNFRAVHDRLKSKNDQLDLLLEQKIKQYDATRWVTESEKSIELGDKHFAQSFDLPTNEKVDFQALIEKNGLNSAIGLKSITWV
jgi:hypothetical protein